MARKHSRPGSTEKFVLRILFLVVAAVGVLAILHFSGIYRLPMFTEDDEDSQSARVVLPEGTIMVPAASRNLQAYSQVRGYDLFIASRRTWAEVPLSEDRAEAAGVIRNRKNIIGRVLRRDKPSGRVFTEEDFFPEGTRPGLTAGIPPGKRAVRIEAGRIGGLHGLARGDFVDLIYSFPVETSSDRRDALTVSGARGAELEMQARLSNPEKQSTVRVAARGAMVVEPVSIREMPMTSSTLTQGTVTRSRPVQEVVLAMDPDEAVALTAALEAEAKVVALPLSGRSDDPGDSETPELEPRNPFSDADTELPGVRVVEIIGGRDKKIIAVPGD
jgi:Flp pilus assembly protein CpaB